MCHTPRHREILAGLRSSILHTLRKRRWSLTFLANSAKIGRNSLERLLRAPFNEIETNYETLNALMKFGKSDFKPWTSETTRLLRMARDFDALYR